MQENYRIIVISLIFLNLSNWIATIEIQYGIPPVVKYLLSLFVLFVLIYSLFTKPTFNFLKDNIAPVFIFFLLWSVLMLLTSFVRFNNLFYFQRLFADRYFFIPYLLPIILIFTKFDLNFYKYYLIYASYLLFPIIIIELYTIGFDRGLTSWYENLERINILNIGSNLLLLTSHLLKKKHITTLVLLYFILYGILMLIYGRRGGLISILLNVMVMIYLRLRSPSLRINSRIKIYLLSIAVVIIMIFVGELASSSYAFQRGFSKEAFNESRGLVFQDFFLDFNSTNDWIFGRGIDGRIYRSIYSDGGTLDIVEQGFLTVLLRGGLLYLVPFVLILLRAIYLGIIKSSNDLVKALGFMILIHLVMMFHFNLPDFSTNYVFIWIGIGTCFSKTMRNYTNRDLIVHFNSKVIKKKFLLG